MALRYKLSPDEINPQVDYESIKPSDVTKLRENALLAKHEMTRLWLGMLDALRTRIDEKKPWTIAELDELGVKIYTKFKDNPYLYMLGMNDDLEPKDQVVHFIALWEEISKGMLEVDDSQLERAKTSLKDVIETYLKAIHTEGLNRIVEPVLIQAVAVEWSKDYLEKNKPIPFFKLYLYKLELTTLQLKEMIGVSIDREKFKKYWQDDFANIIKEDHMAKQNQNKATAPKAEKQVAKQQVKAEQFVQKEVDPELLKHDDGTPVSPELAKKLLDREKELDEIVDSSAALAEVVNEVVEFVKSPEEGQPSKQNLKGNTMKNTDTTAADIQALDQYIQQANKEWAEYRDQTLKAMKASTMKKDEGFTWKKAAKWTAIAAAVAGGSYLAYKGYQMLTDDGDVIIIDDNGGPAYAPSNLI